MREEQANTVSLLTILRRMEQLTEALAWYADPANRSAHSGTDIDAKGYGARARAALRS